MGRGVRKGDATTRKQPFIDGRLGVAYGILDRCLRSFSSTSVAAPTLMIAIPPDNFAKRSCSFSRS